MLMRAETESFIAEIEEEKPQRTPSSFALYEEYSHTEMAKTITIRKDSYEKAGLEERRRLEEKAQQEVDNFYQWLEQTKNIEDTWAHYCAISLKSILLGLPIGVQIAYLFGTILEQKGSI